MELTYLKKGKEKHYKGILGQVLLWYFTEITHYEGISYIHIKEKNFHQKTLSMLSFEGNEKSSIKTSLCLEKCIFDNQITQIRMENLNNVTFSQNHFKTNARVFFQNVSNVSLDFEKNFFTIQYIFPNHNENTSIDIKGEGEKQIIYPSENMSLSLKDAKNIKVQGNMKSLSLENSSCIIANPLTIYKSLFLSHSELGMPSSKIDLTKCLLNHFCHSKLWAKEITLPNGVSLKKVDEKYPILDDGVINKDNLIFPNTSKYSGKPILLINGDSRKSGEIAILKILKSVQAMKEKESQEESFKRELKKKN